METGFLAMRELHRFRVSNDLIRTFLIFCFSLSVQNSLADATSSAHESLACIKTVITSASEEYEGSKYAKNINVLYALNIRQVSLTLVWYILTRLC